MLPTISTGNVSSALAGEYEVANSVRLNKSDTPYLNRTNGTATNNDKYTLSLWTKRGLVSSAFEFLIEGWTGNADTTCGILRFRSDDRLDFMGYSTVYRRTTRVFRDILSWYNIIVAVDTTQSTASDRIKMYINGVEETEFDTNNNPSQNANTGINNNSANLNLFRRYLGSVNDLHYGGYCTEYCFIDGQQLDQNSFGEFDSDSPNIWKPIDVTGLNFGTNGFYLPFENSSALGQDDSGNGNNFTVNNLTSIDQSSDTCTNNFATLNSIDKPGTGNLPGFAEGNLHYNKTATGAGNNSQGNSTIAVNSGKWFFEIKALDSNAIIVGIDNADNPTYDSNGNSIYSSDGGIAYYNTGSKVVYGSVSSYGSSWTTNDIISVAINLDDNEITFYKNGSSQGAISITTTGIYYRPAIMNFNYNSASSAYLNFGSPPYSESGGNTDASGFGNFSMALPSGFFSLCTNNLAEFG